MPTSATRHGTNKMKQPICDRYGSRPDICNVDKLYCLKYKDLMTLEEYHDMQHNACEIIKKTFAVRNKERFGL